MSQRGLILRLLREAGPVGVDAHELVYRHGITRAAARIWELRDEGHDIEAIDHGYSEDGRRRMCTYILRNDASAVAVPTQQLAFPCGCVRAADGRSWAKRCPTHGAEWFFDAEARAEARR